MVGPIPSLSRIVSTMIHRAPFEYTGSSSPFRYPFPSKDFRLWNWIEDIVSIEYILLENFQITALLARGAF